jgi:hypothetical protein
MDSERVGLPDLVLVKCFISSQYTSDLLDAGVHYTEKKNRKVIDHQHAEQARAIGRDPDQYRKVPDSGVPIFGKDGLKNVGILSMLGELGEVGYRVTACHIEPGRDQNKDVIVLAFGRDGEEVQLPHELTMFIGANSWSVGHIWANPPNGDGQVVNTANFIGRQIQPPKCELKFAGGLWAVE